ncbi:hypothetical protein B0H13DRAFT_728828 [Mycena leptocephala]|nr:hypothetical protein B0H13DRAFT_728828 [Mycena leptocephala]
MANPSDDAQFASLYGRFLSGPQGGASLGGPVGGAPGLASILTFFSSALASGSCKQSPDTDPCPSLNSVIEFCEKTQNQGKGPCVLSVSSQIEFCQQNSGTDPCPSLNSLNEFCQKNPNTGPCPGINSAVDGSDFCKQHPGTGPCPGTPPVTQSVGPTTQPEPPSPPSPTTPTLPPVFTSTGSTPLPLGPSASAASQASPVTTSSRTTVTPIPTTQLATIASTSSIAGNPEKSSGSSLFPSDNPADPTLAASPTTSTSLAAPSKSHNKAAPIIAGVVVPIVLIILAAAGFILYKRRKRARDRREWERTHAEIADAVRQIGAPVKVAVGPAWSGDLKTAPDGDGDALSYSYEKSGGMESSTRLP